MHILFPATEIDIFLFPKGFSPFMGLGINTSFRAIASTVLIFVYKFELLPFLSNIGLFISSDPILGERPNGLLVVGESIEVNPDYNA